MMIGEDEDGKLEPFSLALCVELIVNMPLEDRVKIKMEDERKLLALLCEV